MKRKEVLRLLILAGVLVFSAPVMPYISHSTVYAAEVDGISDFSQTIFSEGSFNIPNDASLSYAGNLYLGITSLDNVKYVTECQGQYYPTKYESEEYEGETYASTYTEYSPMSFAEAVNQASNVPVGTSFYFDANPSNISTLNEYNEAAKNIYLIVLQGDAPIEKVPFSALNSVIGINSGVGTGTEGTVTGEEESSILKESMQAPVITFSEIPEKTDEEFELIMYSDIDALLTFNGKNNGKHGQSDSFRINSNGDYSYSAMTADGEEVSGVLTITCFTGEGVATITDKNRDSVWKGTGQEVDSSVANTEETDNMEADANTGKTDSQSLDNNIQEELYQTGIESSIPVVSGVFGLGGIGLMLAGLKKGRKGGIDEN